MTDAHLKIFAPSNVDIATQSYAYCQSVIFVNECRSGRIPDIFLHYYKIRDIGLELRNNMTFG